LFFVHGCRLSAAKGSNHAPILAACNYGGVVSRNAHYGAKVAASAAPLRPPRENRFQASGEALTLPFFAITDGFVPRHDAPGVLTMNYQLCHTSKLTLPVRHCEERSNLTTTAGTDGFVPRHDAPGVLTMNYQL